MTKRFRITDITGPDGEGMLNLYYYFYIQFEYDPGEPYKSEQGKVVIRLSDSSANTLAERPIESPNIDPAISRIRFYVTNKLRDVLSIPAPELNHAFVIMKEDVDNLLRVDYKRVSLAEEWISLETKQQQERKKVFVSCGQTKEEEIALGKQIVDLVKRETGLECYFAETQNSLEDVIRNIFDALYNSTAFIVVMHRRSEIQHGEFRASVWIEQEVAIAAFLKNILKIPLLTKAYIQNGVKQEGIREFIILNPTEFNENNEVIEDLHQWLPLIKKMSSDR